MLILLALYMTVLLLGLLDFGVASIMLSTRSGAARIMRRRRFHPGCWWTKRWVRLAARRMRAGS